MPRKPCTFRQTDVTRAVKAVQAAGIEVGQVEIGPDGRIVISAQRPTADGTSGGGNEWDTVYDTDSAPVRPRVS